MTLTPIWLWIDPSQQCNIACSICYTKAFHQNRFLTLDKLRDIMANIKDDRNVEIRELTFNWRGEPLMNKQFPELLHYLSCQNYPFPVQFHTNATLLSERLSSRIVDNAPNVTVYLSIDGGSRESHEANRGLGTYARALRGAWNLLKARGESKTPRIILYQLDLRECKGAYDSEYLELAAAVDFWQRVRPILPGGDHEYLAEQPERAGGSPTINGWDEVPYQWPAPLGPCFWIGNAICVNPIGEAYLCVLSKEGSATLGNLTNEPISVILTRAQAARIFVKAHGREKFDHCRGCRKKEGEIRPPKAVPNLQSSLTDYGWLV